MVLTFEKKTDKYILLISNLLFVKQNEIKK
jgi:hypothetical protein